MTDQTRSNIPKLFFSKEEQHRIGESIAAVEEKTSAEVRVRIERNCDGDALARARVLINELGMTKTKERTGVLIYIALEDHRFAIFGDEGIHKLMGDEGWAALSNQLAEYFRKSQFCEGLVNIIYKIGEVLAKPFPPAAENVDELTNEPSFGE
ncbi:TPM domain-containing protein [bacterium]|nr:TPM domain-containing protein [bacterium]